MTAPFFSSGTANWPAGIPNPSFTTSLSVKPRILTSDFGDGYSQRTLDGINFNRQVWQVVWENLLDSERNNITNFLNALAGVGAFLWFPPKDPAAGAY